MIKQQNLLRLEFFLLYGGIPLLALGQPRSFKLTLILIFAIFALVMLRHADIRDAAKEWNWKAVKRAMPIVLPRLFVFCAALTMLLLLLMPAQFLSFPLQRPGFWAMVMLWYPILSVLPQELIYRSLYFHRYSKIFKNEKTKRLMSAVMFGWAHIIFLNPLVLLLCGIGGYVFAHSYRKYGSLAVAWIEHSILGCFLFTVGLGAYFYGMPHH